MRFFGQLGKAEGLAVSTLLVVITVVATAQVVTRYVLKVPTPWIEELARYLMVWMVLLGAGLAVRSDSHLAIDALRFVLPRRAARWLQVGLQTIVLIFGCYYAWISYLYLIRQVEGGQVSPGMQISMGWVFAALVVGGVLIMVHSVERLAVEFKGSPAESVGELEVPGRGVEEGVETSSQG